MNISLPDSLKPFVDEQADQHGFNSGNEYVQALISKEQDRSQLRGLLLEGAKSPPTIQVDKQYFSNLRNQVNRQTKRET